MVDMRIMSMRRWLLLATLVAVPFVSARGLTTGEAGTLPAPASVPADEAAKPYQEADPNPVPPGPPPDQSLWKQCGEVSWQITAVRTASSGLQWRIHSLDLVARLVEAAKGASADEARRLEALRERLVAAQVENYGILTSQWPVDPTRGCQYPQLMLGSAMRVADGPDKRALMGQAREDAQRCVETASMAVGRLSRSNETLSQAVDASVKAVPWPSAPGAPSGPRKD